MSDPSHPEDSPSKDPPRGSELSSIRAGLEDWYSGAAAKHDRFSMDAFAKAVSKVDENSADANTPRVFTTQPSTSSFPDISLPGNLDLRDMTAAAKRWDQPPISIPSASNVSSDPDVSVLSDFIMDQLFDTKTKWDESLAYKNLERRLESLRGTYPHQVDVLLERFRHGRYSGQGGDPIELIGDLSLTGTTFIQALVGAKPQSESSESAPPVK